MREGDGYLHEEVLLLALRDQRGTIFAGTQYTFAIGGAILAELLLRRRIDVDNSTKRKLVQPRNPTPVGEPLIDECLMQIRQATRRGSLQAWVGRFAAKRRLKHRVAEQLCRRGVLRLEEDRVLLVFNRKAYPTANPEPESKIVARLQRAIFNEGSDVDPRTSVLLALAHHARLLERVFGKAELKPYRTRIRKLAQGEIAGQATREAIQAMETAVTVAALTATG